MMCPVKSISGKLLFKWDKEKRMLEIQRSKEVSYFTITQKGEIEAVMPPKQALDAKTING